MKNTIKVLLFYLLFFLIFTFFYLFLFNTSLFSSQKVLFYRGLILLTVNTIIFFIFSLLFLHKLKINLETLFAAILVSVSINLSFFVVFPVTIERSVTMYLLKTLRENSNNSCQGLKKSDLEEKLIKDYVMGKAVEKRANEQKIIGFIKEENQCLQLTSQAIRFLNFSKIIGHFYGLR